LDYFELIRLWKNEKSSSSLCKIPKDLYISLDGTLAKLNEEVQSVSNKKMADDVLDRILYIRNDIMHLRIVKLVNMVINNVSFDENVLTWGERRIVENLRVSIETIGIEKPNILDTQDISPETDQYENSEDRLTSIQDIHEKQPSGLDYTVVRMLDDVEAFFGLDNLPYGPLTKKDIVNMPSKNAEALIARGVARLIETPEN
jgi:DNA replication initiation complex subunit (GINS family)